MTSAQGPADARPGESWPRSVPGGTVRAGRGRAGGVLMRRVLVGPILGGRSRSGGVLMGSVLTEPIRGERTLAGRIPLADPRWADPRWADPRWADPRWADPRWADPRPAGNHRARSRWARPGAWGPDVVPGGGWPSPAGVPRPRRASGEALPNCPGHRARPRPRTVRPGDRARRRRVPGGRAPRRRTRCRRAPEGAPVRDGLLPRRPAEARLALARGCGRACARTAGASRDAASGGMPATALGCLAEPPDAGACGWALRLGRPG